jgi:quercetin dioxygenase-like cupin family protein
LLFQRTPEAEFADLASDASRADPPSSLCGFLTRRSSGSLSPAAGRSLISTERMMIAHVYLEKGAIVPWHSYENEQLTYILEGTLRFWLQDDQGEVVDVAAGEVLHIPSQLPHKAEALERVLDVDIFCPPRSDWLDGSDTYLRASDQ